MGNMIIVPLNQHDEATLSVSPALETGFPATNTQNRRRYSVFKSTSGAGQEIGGVLAANRIANYFGMFRHTCHGGSVRFQLWANNNFTGATYDTTALAVSNVTPPETYGWGRGTIDPLLSRTPYRIIFPDFTYRSYKITFSGTPTSGLWAASRFFIGEKRVLRFNPGYGAKVGFNQQSDRTRSRGGSYRASTSEKWKTFEFDLPWLDETDRAFLLDFMELHGLDVDFVAELFPDETTRLSRDHVMNCVASSLNAIGRQVSFLTSRLQFEEC